MSKEMKDEKEPTVTMSVKSWENLDKDLSLTEHQLVGALTNVRLIRGGIHKSMKTWLEGRMDENLVRVTELEESVRELREMLDEAKAKGEKEKKQDE